MTKAPLLFLCGTLLQMAPALAITSEENVNGQYLCHIERAAGLNHRSMQPPFAGTIKLPESELSFAVTVRPIVRDRTSIILCKHSFEHFLPMLDKGQSYKPFDAPKFKIDAITYERRNIGWQCLTNDEALLITSGSQRQSKYRSYDYSSEFYGLQASDWFALYGNGTFQRSMLYNSGIAIAEGRCVKMPGTK